MMATGKPGTKFLHCLPAIHDRTTVIGARRLAEAHGWRVAADGAHWRRVVASPELRRLVESESVARLVDAGTVVVCGGGGGAPVVEDGRGRLSGVEALVDKDLTSALPAIALKADRLVLLADVPAVVRNFGTPDAQPLSTLELIDLAHLEFAAGSLGPKVEACRRFVAATGHAAAIGSLTAAAAVLDGTEGTTVFTVPTRSP